MNIPNTSSIFSEIRKPLIASGLGFAYSYMLENDLNKAMQYGSIIGLSNILSVKASNLLLPEIHNEALNSIKNMSTQGALTGLINSGLQMVLSKDVLYMENSIIGAGCTISAIILEPTFASII